MNIVVTGRHVDVTDAMREYASRKIENILTEFPRVISVHVILDVQKYRHIAEVVLQAAAHIRIEAREESDGMYKSIDMVVDKIDRQMQKSKEKIQQHHKGHETRKD